MAGEAYLISGDQIATYGAVNITYPGGVTHVRLTNVRTLGDADSRFFLVRTQGEGDEVTNGQFFEVYPAVDDGNGNLVPGPTPVIGANFSTPDAYGGTGAGDDYIMFGLFGGPRFVIDINGIGNGNYTAVQGQDIGGGNMDGEFNLSDLAAANPDGAICFTSGTPIDTPRGPVPVEQLRVGDLVTTLDDGPRPIRWIGCSIVEMTPENHDLAPVEIDAGAFGHNLPNRTIAVSPAHRLLVADSGAQLILGEDEVLAPANALINGTTVRRRAAAGGTVTYWHLMFDRHQIITSAGLASESFHPGAYALDTLSRATRAEVLRLFPALADCDPADGYGPTARPIARGFEARLLALPDRAA
ncbi:Hint domain-containing protein [Vannielia litorea]|uniref:Hint domain-containing protein n=1 Tax=Vannielia litorea TaxID=1217970 RepID=UPI001BD0504D|nr:Hint domain-containing protein [Vannielia litorea]MBS8227806.1 hypothetical protein [Vannielia litorea]